MSFIEEVMKKAREDRKTIVLPESYEIRTLEATAKIYEKDVADIILIGDAAKIKAAAGNWDISKAKIVNPETFADMEAYANAFYELRKNKGMTLEKARETMLDPLFLGVMMVKQGAADGMVAGAVNSTSNTLRPALQILKTAPGTKLVSAFFLMDVPDCEFGHNGLFIFADSGLVENPDADALSEIALSSAKSFRQLTGAEPKVAMLSYSTMGSAKSELTEKVIEATRLAKEKAPELALDGELQVDAAIVASVGKSKAPNSTVAGSANVLVFPISTLGISVINWCSVWPKRKRTGR